MIGYDRAAAAYENRELPLDGCPCTDQIIYLCGGCGDVTEITRPIECCEDMLQRRVEDDQLIEDFPVESCPTHADTDDR